MLSLVELSIPKRLGPVSCELITGQHIGLIGPNGSGKSSLLLAIAGLLSSQGNVFLKQQNILQWSIADAAQRRAMLPQKLIQLLPIACHEVIALGASPLFKKTEQIAQAVGEITERLELVHFYQRDFSALSGGEQQRVLLAKTLLQVWPSLNSNGQILLLDEPLAGLDLYHQLQLLELLNELAQKGLTIITSLHDFNVAATHCDHILCMNEGKLAFSDSPAHFHEQLIEDVFHIRTIRTESHGQIQFIPWKTTSTQGNL